MDVSAECCGGTEPPDDLTSFEVVNPLNPVPPDLTDQPRAHEPKEKPKLKTKLISAWNNVKYGGWSLKTKPRLSKSSPVFLLGQSYQLSYTGERECFRRAFSSLLWLTYRRCFPPLDGSDLTSDAGWGCMIRSAQMLLAHGLMQHLMPAGWTWPATHHQTRDDLEIVDLHVLNSESSGNHRESPHDSGKARRRSLDTVLDSESHDEEETHRKVVSWFADMSSAPFGLHRLVELGRASGKRAGDWYGPAIVAHILQKAVAASVSVTLLDLVVYVAQDCTVYIGDVLNLCGTSRADLSVKSGSGLGRFKSLILLVPVRLGSDVLNPAYTECVKRLLKLRCCIGIIGGKPKHSLFFVGFQNDQLVYLDPHYCQTAVDVKQNNFPLWSFHCKSVRKMPFNRMDPSCTLGFYARNRADFHSLCSDVTQALTSSDQKYPIFTFVEGQAEEERGCNFTSNTYMKTKDRRRRMKPRTSAEEFVLL